MRILAIVVNAIMAIVALYFLVIEQFSWTMFWGLFLFGGGFIFIAFEDRIAKWQMKQQQKRIQARFCQLKEDHIFFPKGYYFKYGFLANRKTLPYECVEEIRMNTIPITAKINDNEIIFLLGLEKETVFQLAENQNISIIHPQDNWSLLCDQYLDTEFNEEQIKETKQHLIETGISEAEQHSIDNVVKVKMLLRTSLSWEWQYYGQYDLLNALRPITEKKYWWTMEVALRKKLKST